MMEKLNIHAEETVSSSLVEDENLQERKTRQAVLDVKIYQRANTRL
jgi:hypothetical protein